ncbi:MATE family efflux transporter [Paenibacillus aurantius]|uniref:Probable multidrug resistance protein NorM n=1 Tax=Paenibacillus aurantius TaxID=2918900 RepID=A0AA96RF78_9BACL|nr:MATE family efflux transporter [Paenibacillus aurantius]WNQ10978.1 MATE family efflux transporter [Paenibacillus aurantius]
MKQLGLRRRGRSWLEKHLSGESMDYRQILALFLPILIDQAFIVGLNLVNTAMISSSGVAAISAVSTVDSLNIFLINVFVAVATGGTVIVAQYKGSGDLPMVSKAASAAVASVSLLALAVGLLLIVLQHPALNLLFGSADEEVRANAKIYLTGSGLSYLGIGIVQAVSGVMRGVGRTRVSLALSLIMNVIYVLLNVVFLYLLDMGVLGMTIAVNLARYTAALCALVYVLRMEVTLHLRLQELFHVSWSMLKRILYIGLPFAAEQMFFHGGKILTQVFIVSLGTYAIATNAISNTIAMLYQIPAGALSLTIVTVVGQCMGGRNVEDARKFIRVFLWLGSFSFVIMLAILMPLFHPLVSLFHPPAEILHDLYWVILINALAQIPLWAISFILPSGLRAAGDSRFTSLTSMLTMWLFRIVLGYVLGIVLGFGIIGVWAAMNGEWGVRGLLFLWRFRGKKWYAHKLI